MGLSAGRLDARIQLQRKNSVTKQSGAEDPRWTDLANVPAEVLPVSGRESFASQQRYAQVDTRFIIRFRKGLTPVNRVIFRGREYDIVENLEIPGGRPDRIELLATARAE